jgi:hypothetical protein
VSRHAWRPRANHADVAARLRSNPREWQRVSVHRGSAGANGAAWKIRTAYDTPCYEPAGAFETDVTVRGDDYAVVARWLGADHEDVLRRKANTTESTTRTGGAR